MCYANASGQEGASIIGRVIDWLTVASVVLLILIVSGCVHRSGTAASGSGTIYNNAVFNITTPGPVLTPMGLKGGATRANDSGQTVLPSATAESSQGVSATGTGNIVIQFRQGSTETQAPAASGINATIPVTVPSSSASQSLLRSTTKSPQ